MNGYSIHHTRRDLDMEAIAAFDDREEAREAARLARAAAAGHTHAVCPRCGDIRTLGWAGGECNNYDPYTEDELCGGVYRAAGGAA